MMILEYLLSALALGMTFLYGSTGEIITEKAGHLNLGIPGIMCIGAAGGCSFIHLIMGLGVNVPVIWVVGGMLFAFISASLAGLLYSFLAVSLKANQNVTGLVLTTFGVAFMKYVMYNLTDDSGGVPYLKALSAFRFPFASSTSSLQKCGVTALFAIVIALATSFVLYKTRVGLHLRAVGENPATADAAGINVPLYKYAATCIGSGIAGIGGLSYIMNCSGSREGYLSIEAFGWLAIALVIFALWKPHLSIFGSFLFGLLYIAGAFIPSILPIQALKNMWATPLFEMLPYVVTILVLIITSVKEKKENQPPASLGLSYFREER